MSYSQDEPLFLYRKKIILPDVDIEEKVFSVADGGTKQEYVFHNIRETKLRDLKHRSWSSVILPVHFDRQP